MSARRPHSPASRPPQPRPGKGRATMTPSNPTPDPRLGSKPGQHKPGPHSSARRTHEEPAAPAERFRTKRSVRIGGGKGSREYSLRLLAIALFAILAVIIVTPTFSHYLARQQELSETRAELVDTQARVKELQRELELWNDDDYVRTQARERLGYVTPGETLYVVADPSEGSAQDRLQEKIDKVNRDRRAATPWYVTLSDSISVAGQAGEIDNPDETPVIQPVTTATPTPTASSATPSPTVSSTE